MNADYGFLHIGKTGGTAIREVITQHNDSQPDKLIRYFGHRMSLRKIANEDLTPRLIFIVREPVSRFISAFNSRLRKGKRGDKIWRPEEEKAFERFKTPNSLAEALSSSDVGEREAAEEAMNSIGHLKKSLNRFIGPVSLLEKEKGRIFFIGDQKHLTEDFETLKRLIGMNDDIRLPEDPRTAHRAPDTVDRSISELGAANIRRHYKDDYPVYEWCLKRRQEILASIGK